MSNSTRIKGALLTLLAGAALVGRAGRGIWVTIALLAFGALNVILPARETEWLSAVAIAGAFSALLWPDRLGGWVLFLAWALWHPAFMVAWERARQRSSASEDPRDDRAAPTRARLAVAALIGAVALGSLAFRLLVAQRLEQTAALFIGIPALLALVVVFTVSPRTATGVACKAVTVGLLVSLLFLGEGVLCVAMSAPLFYAIAIAIARSMGWSDWAADEPSRPTLFSCLVVLAVVPMSLEGVTPFTTLNREETVAESRIVHASPEAVERALFEAPRFDRVLPLYLRGGFPSPVSTRIDRSVDRTRWVIGVRGGEMRLNGMEPRTGDLVLELEETRPGFVRWRAVSDTSHMTHFLTWREAVVQWEPVDAQTTKVTWTLRYRRDLDPSFYFGPMERYAVQLAAGYLIDAVATP